MNKKQDIQNQIEKLKEEIKTLEDKVEGLDKKGSEKNWRAKEGAGYWSLTYNGKAFNPVEEGEETVIGQDGLEYGVIKAKDGHKWLDRNIGATRAATAVDDDEAYGGYFQWGRGLDGHSDYDSGTTSTLSSTDNPGHSNFILDSSTSPYDWRSPQNNNLWQGVDGVNNVCPVGFRIPTSDEWTALVSAENITNLATAYTSSLRLPAAGYRSRSSGRMNLVGSNGYYWSSTISGTLARSLNFNASSVYPTNTNTRANGFTVRCIKD